MNADTKNAVAQIKKQGYYNQSTSLGEGGWPLVRTFTANWKTYHLFSFEDQRNICTITAKSDAAAKKAFASLFRLDEFNHDIIQESRKYRTVKE